MPNVTAERLTEIEIGLLVAAGASAEEAATVARYNVGANLVGHDSHGIILIPQYIDRIKAGHIVPGAPWEIKQETPTTTVIDGNWGFGYVVNDRAMRYTIEKAKKQNVAAATVLRQSHVGRLASYPLLAAAEGMIAMITADSGRIAQGGRAVRRRQGPAGHQSDQFRDPIQSGRAVRVRHGDVRRRRRQDQRRHRARRAGADRLADRRRGPAVHRSESAEGRRRVAAVGRHRGLQRHRPRRDRRDPVRSADRTWFRYRSDRAGTTMAASWPCSMSRRSATWPRSSRR